MTEKQIASVRLVSVDPIRLGKDGYVRRIENALDQISTTTGKTLTPDERKKIATAMATDMLRVTIDEIKSESNKAQKSATKSFKGSAIKLASAVGIGLSSVGLLHYANQTSTGNFFSEVATLGLLGVCVAAVDGIASIVKGTFDTIRVTRLIKHLPKLVYMREQLRREVSESDLSSSIGENWKN